jgi:hypothetical protein
MPTFTREQHATAVNNELNEAISSLDKKAKRRLLKAMAISMEDLATKANAPPQRVNVPSTSEGGTKPTSHDDDKSHRASSSADCAANSPAEHKAQHAGNHHSN